MMTRRPTSDLYFRFRGGRALAMSATTADRIRKDRLPEKPFIRRNGASVHEAIFVSF